MLKIFQIVTILLAITTVFAEENQEIDPDTEYISDFLIDLISKYDDSGIGAIPTEKYPDFLSDVFLTGNSISEHHQSINQDDKNLLLEATTGFSRKYNETEVGIQEFYSDLVKDFTIYLTQNNEKYQPLLDIFFSQTSQPKEETNTDEKTQL